MAHKNNATHCDQETRVALRIAAHQQHHGQCEVDEERTPEQAWMFVDTLLEIGHLFRNVTVPDQHELAEVEIAPKKARGEDPLSKVLDVAVVHLGQQAFALQIEHQDHRSGHRTAEHTCKHVPSEQGTEPMRIDAHDPIPRQGTAEDREEHQEQGTATIIEQHALGQCFARFAVHLKALLAEEIGKEQEGAQV